MSSKKNIEMTDGIWTILEWPQMHLLSVVLVAVLNAQAVVVVFAKIVPRARLCGGTQPCCGR